MPVSIKLVNFLVARMKELDDTDVSDSEYAEELVKVVDEFYGQTKRLLVVGQIQHDGDEETYTVALGPFTARGVLDSPEKFRKAATESTRAHESGGKLAWDPAAGKGRGRYMIVPLFHSPRDAWSFYKGLGPAEELIRHVTRDDYQIYPACTCGLRGAKECYRHDRQEGI